MDTIKLARELGKAIQADERYLTLKKCFDANEKDTALNDLMASVQLLQLSYQAEASKETPDEAKLEEMNKQFENLYSEVMKNDNMKNFEAARKEVDDMMNYIVELLYLCVNGEDPETCEPQKHEHGCDCGCEDHDHDCDCGCH